MISSGKLQIHKQWSKKLVSIDQQANIKNRLNILVSSKFCNYKATQKMNKNFKYTGLVYFPDSLSEAEKYEVMHVCHSM